MVVNSRLIISMAVRKCPVCGKDFSNRQTLRKHVFSAHPDRASVIYKQAPQGKPSKRKMNPALVKYVNSGIVAPRRQRPKGQSSGDAPYTASGTGLVTSVLDSFDTEKVTIGTILISRRISPGELETRLQAESKMWTNWRPRRMVFKASCAASTNVSGSWIMAWSRDLHQHALTGPQLVSLLFSAPVHTAGPVHRDLRLTVPMSMTRQWYTTASLDEEEESCHGRLYCLATSPWSGIAGKLSVLLTLDWEMTFMGRSLIPPVISGGPEIFPDLGYSPVFVTTTSSWQGGKYAVFKHTAGASPVPFSRAQFGVVYKAAEGVSIKVRETGKTTDSVLGTAFRYVRIKDWDTPTLTICETEEKALAYVRTGDPTNLWDKVDTSTSAGVSTPAIIAFTSSVLASKARMAELESQVSRLTSLLSNALAVHDPQDRSEVRALVRDDGLSALTEKVGAIGSSLGLDPVSSAHTKLDELLLKPVRASGSSSHRSCPSSASISLASDWHQADLEEGQSD